MNISPVPPQASLYASRVRVYPRAVRGAARTVKWVLLGLCLAVYYITPWIRWDRGPGRPNQMILLDVGHERFYFLDLTLWPQDVVYLTGALTLGAIALFLATSLAGRVWCGYTCPQTVWTDLFMWVERLIEGDRNERMRRDQGPTTADKVWRKIAKHAVWLGVAFWTGGAWIMYYADAPTVTRAFWSGTASMGVYGFTFLFTATTYLLAGWAREQVCTYMCPWPRFQAAMLDEQSLIVTYQGWRGEPRGHGKRSDTPIFDKHGNQLGDCIDCHACVTVCPTGVDIRDGVQLGCINCGLCVDACNEIMEKTNRPKYLVTWDTLARQKLRAAGSVAPLRLIRPRTVMYGAAFAAGFIALVAAIALRPLVEFSVQHDRAPLFVTLRDGSVRNAYTVKIANKRAEAQRFELVVTGLADVHLATGEVGEAQADILQLDVPADSVGSFRILAFARPHEAAQDLKFRLRSPATGDHVTAEAAFMGPAGHR